MNEVSQYVIYMLPFFMHKIKYCEEIKGCFIIIINNNNNNYYYYILFFNCLFMVYLSLVSEKMNLINSCSRKKKGSINCDVFK